MSAGGKHPNEDDMENSPTSSSGVQHISPSPEATPRYSTSRRSTGTKSPPINSPVGLAAVPNLGDVTSKIGSLDNIDHKPLGGDKKVPMLKLDWQAKSKVGSLDYANHQPGGGQNKVFDKMPNWSAVTSKVGSLDNADHIAGGGNVKIVDDKYYSGRRSRSSSSKRGGSRSRSRSKSREKDGSQH